MKKVLLGIISIISLQAAYAQKLVFALHGGVGANSVPQRKDSAAFSAGSAALFNYVVSLNAYTNVRDWQFGLGVDMQPISRKSPKTKHVFANPASPIYLMANRKFGRFYTGADFGMMVANSADNVVYGSNKLTPEVINYEPGIGLTGGLKIGYNLELSEKVDACVQLRARYGSTSYDYSYMNNGTLVSGKDRYAYFYYGLTVGFSLKMFRDQFRQW